MSQAERSGLVPIDPGRVSDETRVVHVDQLGDRAQERLDAAASGAAPPEPPESLSAGDVVVFTDYYRVR